MHPSTRIIESELCVLRVQFRFPRSKKKRIQPSQVHCAGVGFEWALTRP